MNQLEHIPNHITLPILQRFLTVYKLWHDTLPHISKTSRYTLGEKVDQLFVDTLEAVYIAGFLPKEEKLPYLQKAIGKLDLLKFFLQISWEVKALDNKKYILLSEPLNEVGKMLGGWLRQTTPPEKTRVVNK